MTANQCSALNANALTQTVSSDLERGYNPIFGIMSAIRGRGLICHSDRHTDKDPTPPRQGIITPPYTAAMGDLFITSHTATG